jgi:hypothetical protein
MTLAIEQPGKQEEALKKEAQPNETLLALGWAALPACYRIPEVAPTLDEAQAYCKRLAESHYENFHVASWFLPKALRPHFHALYAYCRILATKWATAPRRWRSSICGNVSSTPATRAARSIPYL